ncbi:sensor histidine kinase [Ekhidna sp.]
MFAAYISTLTFGVYYFRLGIPELYYPTFLAFLLFVIFSALSFFSVLSLVTLFRLSVITTLLAFYNQIFFTGGVLSAGILEFIIPTLLAFFYRPVRDRYIFMSISGLALISIFILSGLGYTRNELPAESELTHGIICATFIFTIISIFTFLFRNALIVKNKKIGDSMKELQETTHKLIQSEKMASLGMLSAGVAHEINNPLNFIKGGIEVLEEGLNEEKSLKFEAEPCIHVIKEGLSRATVIVNSLNHFSRRTDSMNETCDLNEILNNSLVMLQPKLKYKGKVIKELSEEKLTLKGNEGKLHQAFLNILSNAEQAIERNGTVTVKTKGLKTKTVVEIADNGEGISKENLKKISDPFFTTKPVGKGTGLGLSITYKIIEEHNGKIRVTSKQGKGTKFVISFNKK